jgi:hypothetical protein
MAAGGCGCPQLERPARKVTRDKITRTALKRWNQGVDYALLAGGIFQVPLAGVTEHASPSVSGRFRILRLLDAN